MREINKIIIHCSASSFGDAALIREWHTDPKPRGNGWRDIGYHYVIGNGRPVTSRRYNPKNDGLIEHGRPLDEAGAHARGHNRDSIGICLIGTRKGLFRPRQIEALRALVESLRAEYGLARADVIGHRSLASKKTCPGFDVRAWV